MVKVICGPQGSGKTRQLIDSCNLASESAKGNVVYVTDSSNYTYQVKIEVRHINVLEYGISNMDQLKGFLAGLLAGNSDIEYIYLDRARRISGCLLTDMEEFYNTLEDYAKRFDVKFVLTASAELDKIPEFLKKFVSK